jgi:hypothetical protein
MEPGSKVFVARKTVVTEKFQAMVTLGAANSRMKDYYDLLALAHLFSFEDETLKDAFRATFSRRKTELPHDVPVGLSDAFGDDPLKITQWAAFTRRAQLLLAPRSNPARPTPRLRSIAHRESLPCAENAETPWSRKPSKTSPTVLRHIAQRHIIFNGELHPDLDD